MLRTDGRTERRIESINSCVLILGFVLRNVGKNTKCTYTLPDQIVFSTFVVSFNMHIRFNPF